MKQIMYRIFLVMCFCTVTIGCEDDFEDIGEEYYPTDIEYGNRPLGLGSTSVSIDGFGGNFHCTLYANEQQPWQITGLPSWLTVTKMQGIGNDMITFSAKENPSESTDRSARLYIESTLKDFPLKIAYDVHQRARPKLVAVDLGLSVKWATFNVGAYKPEESGKYYAWGETEEKGNYEWDTYKYYNNNTDYVNIGSNISGTQYDVAHVKWGGSWRMPTLDEIKELINKCTWKWTTQNRVNGRLVTGHLVTGPNGNSIFLPAVGRRIGTDFDFDFFSSYGYYWSATLNEGISDAAYYLYFNSGGSDWNYGIGRYAGYTVRPVTE